MDLEIKGLRVLVTAGANGIGRAIARAFAAKAPGFIPATSMKSRCLNSPPAIPPSRRRRAMSPTAPRCRSCSRKRWQNSAASTCSSTMPASPARPAKVEEMNPEDWDRCLEICLTGQFNCTRLAVPHLRKSKNASIVNISSAAGRLGFAMRTPYAAAKWGVIGFTKSLSIELGPDNIRVNAILPGLVAGDRQRRVLEAKAQQRGISYAEMERTAFSYTSIKDYVTPEQIADQILFMCSPRGKTISGQAISVCGDTQMLG